MSLFREFEPNWPGMASFDSWPDDPLVTEIEPESPEFWADPVTGVVAPTVPALWNGSWVRMG